MGEIGDQPPDIGLGNTEQIGDLVREPFDTQAGIKKQSTEIGRRHQILQVAVGSGDRFELDFQFAVDGPQLVIGRSQLLVSSASSWLSVPILLHGAQPALIDYQSPLQPPHGAAFRPRSSAAVRVIVVRHRHRLPFAVRAECPEYR